MEHPHLSDEEGRHDPLDPRMLVAEALEVSLVHGEGLGLLERLDPRGAAALAADQGHLTEVLAGATHSEGDRIAQRSHDLDREVAGGYRMDGVAGVIGVEHDLATGKPPASRDREQQPYFLCRDAAQEGPLHWLSVCHGRDNSSVRTRNDSGEPHF